MRVSVCVCVFLRGQNQESPDLKDGGEGRGWMDDDWGGLW